MRRLLVLGGVISMVSLRIYGSWNKYDSKDMDEIVKLSSHID